jgi:hypothetical protein
MKEKLDNDHPKSKEMTKEAREARKKAHKLMFKVSTQLLFIYYV